MCAIGPKGKARTFELRASSGYLTPSNGYIGFPYHPLVRPKRHGTACAIGPKGEARTLGLRVPWGPYIQEVIYMGWVQLSSLVRPKRHGTACAIGPKGEASTLGPRVPSVPKAKLGHSDRVRHWSQRRS